MQGFVRIVQQANLPEICAHLSHQRVLAEATRRRNRAKLNEAPMRIERSRHERGEAASIRYNDGPTPLRPNAAVEHTASRSHFWSL
jgi:hypothetical protein